MSQKLNKSMFIAGIALLFGVLLWSMRSPERSPVEMPGASRTSTPNDAAADAERDRLETPPPLVMPQDDARRTDTSNDDIRYPAFLPKEALATLQLIERGGPYPYRQDDGVFQNRERKLPQQPRGYYREFTVETPGSRDRGARRIVAGGQPPVEFFYTDDHYRSFRRFTSSASMQDGDATGSMQ